MQSKRTSALSRRAFAASAIVISLTALLSTAWPVPIAVAQVPTGSIEGTVVDIRGAAIPDARIAIIQSARGRKLSADTTSKGVYVVSALEAGDYELKFTAKGFKTAVLNLKVEVGEATSGNVSLEVAPSEMAYQVPRP